MRLVFTIFTLIAVGLLSFKLVGEKEQNRTMKNSTILAFGDSLTYGYGTQDPEHESYPARLTRLYGHRIINAGVNGETTAEGLERIDTVLDRYDPGLTILCLGGNDILRGIPEVQIEANLARLIEKIQAHGSQILLVGVPDFGLLGLHTLPLYRRLADRYDLPLEENVLSEILSDPRLKSDSIHPNARGYRLFAEKLYEKLKQEGFFDSETSK